MGRSCNKVFNDSLMVDTDVCLLAVHVCEGLNLLCLQQSETTSLAKLAEY